MELQVEVQYLYASDEEHLAPADAFLASPVHDVGLTPQQGDIIFVSPRSPWTVVLREWEWLGPRHLQVRLRLAYNSAALDLKKRPTPQLVPPEPAGE